MDRKSIKKFARCHGRKSLRRVFEKKDGFYIREVEWTMEGWVKIPKMDEQRRKPFGKG